MDRAYKDQEEWTKKSIRNAIRSGKFSSDRTITEYANQIWGIKPQKVFEGQDSRVIISWASSIDSYWNVDNSNLSK